VLVLLQYQKFAWLLYYCYLYQEIEKYEAWVASNDMFVKFTNTNILILYKSYQFLWVKNSEVFYRINVRKGVLKDKLL
jgi:hypothetical protein